jgi:Fe-S cluster assembly protein SufD
VTTALRDMIANPTTAELELVARYGMQPEEPRRERLFQAFSKTGLPHRRLEAWKWTDFKAALQGLDRPSNPSARDPIPHEGALVFKFSPDGYFPPDHIPNGLNVFEKDDVQAMGSAEEVPLAALAASLSGGKARPTTLLLEVTSRELPRLHFQFSGAGEANFARVVVMVRPDMDLTVSESHLGGAGLTSSVIEFSLQKGSTVNRTVYQRGTTQEAVASTALVHLDANSHYKQTSLSFGARIARLETRVTHQEPSAKATLNAAYLVGKGLHADFTTHVRHGANSCITRQLTKGAVLDGGMGVFQGKFLVPRTAGQFTDADMQHKALLLEDGAVVFAKPELEIYADDVECAHGNTSGALDDEQLFYMRQRGLPEKTARALLTQAFVAEAFAEAGALEEVLRAEAETWLAAT